MGKRSKKIDLVTLSHFDPPLDKGIALYVVTLRSGGIETFQSCEGGTGHAFTEPTVEFHGDSSEGYKALAIAIQYGLPVCELRRVHKISDNSIKETCWAMTFWRKSK